MLNAMRCGTFALALGRGAESGIPVSGAEIAQRWLVEATLAGNPDLTWDMLGVGPIEKPLSRRIRACDVRDLAVQAAGKDYLLQCSLPEFRRAAMLRSRSRLDHVPICVLTHSLWTERLEANCLELLLYARPCDRVVVSSQAARTVLRSALEDARAVCGRSSVPSVELIPFGVELPQANSFERTAARQLLALPTDAFVPVYVGRLSEVYKADLVPLLVSAHHLRNRGIDCYLLLAGATDDRDTVRRLLEAAHVLGLNEYVRLLQDFPEFLKHALYTAADVFVSPADSVQETFGIALLEAMSHGLPVVASSWSGYRDLVLDGVNGFLTSTVWSGAAADEADLLAAVTSRRMVAHRLAQHRPTNAGELLEALTRRAKNPGRARSMGEAGYRHVTREFAASEAADRFLALWARQLIDAGDAAPRSTDTWVPVPHVDTPAEQTGWFAAYASHRMKPTDLLARLAEVEELSDPALLAACGCRNTERMEWLLARTASEPFSIGELMETGFTLEEILWLAKKGLRRIVCRDDE